MRPSSIRRQLMFTFTAAILVPTLLTAGAGVVMIRQRVLAQAQVQVDSNLRSAQTLYDSQLVRIEDGLRVLAARMWQAQAAPGSEDVWGPELAEGMRGDGLDLLTWVGPDGRVIFRAGNPENAGDSLAGHPLVSKAMRTGRAAAGTALVPAQALAIENPCLTRRARMELKPTPRSLPSKDRVSASGLVMLACVPLREGPGNRGGALLGGVLLNRNFFLVDEIRGTVFEEGRYRGRELGTATVFMEDIRISTNVLDERGERALGTRASAEVARAVLLRGRTWRGRAFVVNDWYLSGYAPIRDPGGTIVGMLYVGTLERPFRDALVKNLGVFLGIALLGVALVAWASFRMAKVISDPIQKLSEASRRVARGDYAPRVAVRGGGEVADLAESFNGMVAELARVHDELRGFARNLENRVRDRTAELEGLQTELVRTQKLAAVGKLAAGVAHEINNPLTAVLTHSALLLDELPEGDPRREDLRLVVDETLRCRGIVRSLLDFARQSPIRRVTLDLNAAVKDVQALLRAQPAFRSVSLFNHLAPNLPPVFADPDQVRQVVLNLYLNAAEAMPQGGQIVTATGPAESPGFVELTIADGGEGLSESIRERLFEPFATTKESGTGLGLAVVYGILEAHGGSITLEPSKPRGTLARVRLPTLEACSERGGAKAPRAGDAHA